MKPGPKPLPIADRFWPKVNKNGPGGCWIWTGARRGPGGPGAQYGHLVLPGGQHEGAHRVAYRLMVGPIPEGLQIDHLCRVRLCVNPAHLEAVTPRVNNLRGTGPGATRAAVTHCPAGHEYDLANTTVSKKGQRSCKACDRIYRQRPEIQARRRSDRRAAKEARVRS